MSRCVGNLTTGSSESTPLKLLWMLISPINELWTFFFFFLRSTWRLSSVPSFHWSVSGRNRSKEDKDRDRFTNNKPLKGGGGGCKQNKKKVKRVKSLFLCVCAKSKKQKRRSREVQGRWFCCKRYKMAASKRCHFYLFFPPNFSGFNLNSFNNNKKRRVWCPVGQTIIINHEFLFTFSRWMVFFLGELPLGGH